jgi:hypothetical protein
MQVDHGAMPLQPMLSVAWSNAPVVVELTIPLLDAAEVAMVRSQTKDCTESVSTIALPRRVRTSGMANSQVRKVPFESMAISRSPSGSLNSSTVLQGSIPVIQENIDATNGRNGRLDHRMVASGVSRSGVDDSLRVTGRFVRSVWCE